MRTMTFLAFVSLLLLPVAGAALTPTLPPPTPTPEDACTPRPDPLIFDVRIEPAQPRVGDEVRVTVSVAEVDGLLFGNPMAALHGAALLFGGDPQPFHHEGLGLGGPVTFILHAQLGGTAELSVVVNYETECACGTVCFFHRTVVSPPFPVTVLGPTPTPRPVCTPPLCGDGEVFACPDTCPGGCGTICATRTPTPCPTPPCRNDETFFCPDRCPEGCGLTCATRTATPIPVSGCPGDCNDDGGVDISELIRGVRIALGASEDEQCFVAFDRERSGTLTVDELIAAVHSALTGCGETTLDPRSLACRDSGGVVSPEYCCNGAGDFRDTCSIDRCGECAIGGRDWVTACVCGVDRCFDGTRCVSGETGTPTPTHDPLTPTRTPTPDDSVLPCLQTGGTESTRLCCLGAGPFPDTCRVGPCACPPDASHNMRVCECGVGRCYDSQPGGCIDVRITNAVIDARVI
jgi:hypothetical protein